MSKRPSAITIGVVFAIGVFALMAVASYRSVRRARAIKEQAEFHKMLIEKHGWRYIEGQQGTRLLVGPPGEIERMFEQARSERNGASHEVD